MIAGAFSKHIAHDNADPFIAWELETHFHNLEDYPVCSKEAEAKYMTDQTIRQIYHFFLTTAHACGVQYGKNIRSQTSLLLKTKFGLRQ